MEAAQAELQKKDQLQKQAAQALRADQASTDVEQLQRAIVQGQTASTQLRGQIAELQKQKNDLERVQTVLASGLIGALATAAVAIFGAVSKSGSSKAERELKQLEVLEKAYELDAKGVSLPARLRSEIGLS